MPGVSGWPIVPGGGPGDRRADANGARPGGHAGAGLLADRIAATLVNHEPGWRLPRPSELARRHNASPGEVNAAVDSLISRQLIRRSPDGRLYRSSPADYLILLEGMVGLGASVDPMGGDLTCLSYGVSQRPAPEEAACALQIQPGAPVGVIKLAWALNGTPAAMSTTYLAGRLTEPRALASWFTVGAERGELLLSLADRGSHSLDPLPDWRLRAVAIQMEPPPVSVARKLRLMVGQMAVLVTVLSGDSAGHGPAALTATVLRPDMFKITVETAATEAGGPRPQAAWFLADAGEGL